jgi:hypothetical protein
MNYSEIQHVNGLVSYLIPYAIGNPSGKEFETEKECILLNKFG